VTRKLQRLGEVLKQDAGGTLQRLLVARARPVTGWSARPQRSQSTIGEAGSPWRSGSAGRDSTPSSRSISMMCGFRAVGLRCGGDDRVLTRFVETA